MRRYLLFLGTAISVLLGCAAPSNFQEQPPPPMAFLKNYDTVFGATLKAAQELSWKIMESNQSEGTVAVQVPAKNRKEQEYALEITIKKRKDGLTEVVVAGATPGELDELPGLQRAFSLKLSALMSK